MKFGDTIAAVATPTGMGGVALLRISGKMSACVLINVRFPPVMTLPSQMAVSPFPGRALARIQDFLEAAVTS